jgi:hypothetical protein
MHDGQVGFPIKTGTILMEVKPMETKTTIQDAIEMLARRIKDDVKSEDALRFTQAALNLAHTEQVLAQTVKFRG